MDLTTVESSSHPWDWGSKGERLELLKFRRLEQHYGLSSVPAKIHELKS